MGLIRAGLKAVGSTLSDQWKDYYYCDALPQNVLVAQGQKKGGGGHGNIISEGSLINVADGQCMMIVEDGQIVEFCAEPGEFVFERTTEPSFFAGSFKEGIQKTIGTMKDRFAFGGNPTNDQRIYYFNTKEMTDNRFGTPNPIPFRIVDARIGLDVDVSVRCNGLYSYKIINPILFYVNVCGNFKGYYTRDELESQLKAEFISALQPAFGKISGLQIRPNELPNRVNELCAFLNESLSAKWRDSRGIEVASVAINSVTLPKEDEDFIKEAQRTAMLKNPEMAAATLANAQAEAMKAAAKNSSGAMNGFMGVNMAVNASGINAGQLYTIASQQETTWTCSCGAKNTGKFCSECGKPMPQSEGWVCSCGTHNTGKFCSECGKPKPVLKCQKCGYEFKDENHLPKFCPECGEPLNH